VKNGQSQGQEENELKEKNRKEEIIEARNQLSRLKYLGLGGFLEKKNKLTTGGWKVHERNQGAGGKRTTCSQRKRPLVGEVGEMGLNLRILPLHLPLCLLDRGNGWQRTLGRNLSRQRVRENLHNPRTSQPRTRVGRWMFHRLRSPPQEQKVVAKEGGVIKQTLQGARALYRIPANDEKSAAS